MGSALRTGLTSAHLVQLAFPALQDLPLLAPLPESSSTQLIVAPEVALTKLPSTNAAPRVAQTCERVVRRRGEVSRRNGCTPWFATRAFGSIQMVCRAESYAGEVGSERV